MLRGKSYFLKLFSFNFILVMISVLILGYFAYLKTSSLLDEKINKINMQILEQTQQRVEDSLQSVENAIIQFSLTPSFTNFLDNDLKINNFDNYQKVGNMVLDISTLYAHDSIINSIEIINMEKGWILKNGGVLPIQEAFTQDEIQKLEQSSSGSFWDKISPQYFQYTLKVPFISVDHFQGIVRAKVPSRDITNALTNSKDLGELLLLDSRGEVISPITQYHLTKEDLSPVIQRLHQGEEANNQGQFVASIKGVQYSFSYRQSPRYHWTYLSMVSTLEARRDSKLIGWFIGIAGFLVIGVAFFFSLFVTKRLYLPIQRLYQLVIANSNEKLKPADNEIEFINSRMKEFFRDSKRLEGQLDIQANQLDDFFAFKLFQGEVKQKEIESRFGDQEPCSQYCVLTVQIDTLEGTTYREKDRELLLFAVKNMLGEIAAKDSLFNPILINNTQVLLVGFEGRDAESIKEETYVLSLSIQEQIKFYLKLQVSIGISYPFSKLILTSSAYHEALDVLKARIAHGREAILYSSDFEEVKAVNSGYPSFIVKSLTESIKFADREQSTRFLHLFVSEIFSGQYNYRSCSMFLFLLIIDLFKLSHSSDEMFIQLFKEKSIFHQLDLWLQTSLTELERHIWDLVIEPLIQETLTRNETQQRNIAKVLMQLIHDEYDTDLTLEGCASRLHYNPNYLGQIFKKETGSSFSDYLAQYRFLISKKLLSETDDQIQQIAEKLRFSNSQNFIRYFKKMEGITPKQYRDQLLKV